MLSNRTFVIVGVARADAKAADILPDEGVGRLVLIGAEHGIPLEDVAAIERGAA